MRKRRPGPPPGPRGTGRARRDRRVMRQGGEGVSGELNRVLSGWFGVRITPMFGRFGYFVGEQMFACYPIRSRDNDLWVRLSRSDQARALAIAGGAAAPPVRGPRLDRVRRRGPGGPLPRVPLAPAGVRARDALGAGGGAVR